MSLCTQYNQQWDRLAARSTVTVDGPSSGSSQSPKQEGSA